MEEMKDFIKTLIFTLKINYIILNDKSYGNITRLQKLL